MLGSEQTMAQLMLAFLAAFSSPAALDFAFVFSFFDFFSSALLGSLAPAASAETSAPLTCASAGRWDCIGTFWG